MKGLTLTEEGATELIRLRHLIARWREDVSDVDALIALQDEGDRLIEAGYGKQADDA